MENHTDIETLLTSRTQRIRLHRDRESDEGERKTETEARSKYHQSADSQECVPMAAIVLDTQRFRSLFHLSDRVVLVERTDYGGISQLHRNGKRDLWRTGCRKV